MAGHKLLWAHLLGKDAASTNSPSQILPIAPQDKTATSVRMLLHDTHVNLEKFSARVDGLLQRVDDCRTQVVNTNKLLDVERDKVTTQMLEIANRCQTEMKTHVGTPAQAPALELVHVLQASTEKSLQALEKRIDALQALLETQAHTMHSIQDQQNSLLGTILPLIPIMHGIPAQIDHVKATLSDAVEKSVSTIMKNMEDTRLSLAAETAHKSSPTQVGSSSKSTPSWRRARPNSSASRGEEINVSVSSPLGTRDRGEYRHGLKRTRMETTADHAGDTRFPRKVSRLTPPQPPSTLQTPRTPRRPLVDLCLLPGNGSESRNQNPTAASTPHGYMPTAHGPGPLKRIPPHSDDAAIYPRAPIEEPAVTLPGIVEPLEQDVSLEAIKTEEILEASFSGLISIHSSPFSSPPSSVPFVTTRQLEETGIEPFPHSHLRFSRNVPDPLRAELKSSDRSISNSDASPHKPMSLRDRRAQISRFGRTQTRRFMPLVPWSDEEE